jgi:predicted GNAT superfamily acetyltransferase
VRRNAWFNIEVLGAQVAEYLVNFYGPMTDSINAHDESDRLMVAWPTDPEAPRPTPPAGSTTIEVDTPEDVVVLRRVDPAEALEWRRRVRKELGERLDAGATVTGFTRDGKYVLHAAD